MSYKLLKQGVQRLADGACIPPTMDNVDWQRYQEWLALGNTPEDSDAIHEPVALTKRERIESVLGMTIAEIKAELG